jgi:Pirin C-terminal cupin domain
MPSSCGSTCPAASSSPRRYQAITRDNLTLLSSHDGGALLRLVAGDLASFNGPGVTHTPISYVHATIAPGAQLSVPWSPDFSAFAYVLTGQGAAGPKERLIRDDDLVVFGPGDNVVVRAAERMSGGWDALDSPAARRPADPRADRALRAVRDEHPKRDPPGRHRLPGGPARDSSGRPTCATPVVLTL